MQAFSLSTQFARESTMLKFPEERRKWGESKGAGRGRGERREHGVFFFLPSPSPLSFFSPRAYRKGYYFYSPQSSTVIKSKMAATTTLRTRTRFRPPKIRLHCRLIVLYCIGGMAKTVCEREIGFGAATTQKTSFSPPHSTRQRQALPAGCLL